MELKLLNMEEVTAMTICNGGNPRIRSRRREHDRFESPRVLEYSIAVHVQTYPIP
jgi:hypothetical protein